MYRFGVRLDSFGSLPEAAQAGIVARFVEALAFANLAWLEQYPDTLPLYAANVRYVCDGPDCGDDYDDLPGVYASGESSCVALTAIRLAELWRNGERASAAVLVQPHSRGVTYHLSVERADGSNEDPSAILGM